MIAEYENHNPHDIYDAERYSLLKCPNCQHPILTQEDVTDNDFEQRLEWGTPRTLYPNNAFHINPVIPEALRNCLAESIQCFNGSLYTATVIMCRRTLEGYCQEMAVSPKLKLVSALNELQANGTISPQLYQWATLLRTFGNKAAHDITSQFSEEDAKDLLDFTIAILDFTYSFKDKFDKFISRQNILQTTN